MKELIQITVDKQIRSNPKKLAQMIIQLSTEINECRDDLSELKNRNFWERTFSNNTRDLADALIKQNDSISTFLSIVQVLIGFNLHNAVVLGGLYQELNKVSGQTSVTDNQYFQLAQDYISETLKAAQKTNKKFDDFGVSIDSIKTELEEIRQIDKEQYEIINSLKLKYEQKEKIDIKQNLEIDKLNIAIKDKDLLDKQQSDDLEFLKKVKIEKDNLDTEQSNKIDQLYNEIQQIKADIESLRNNKLNELGIEKDILDSEQSNKIDQLYNEIQQLKVSIESLKNNKLNGLDNKTVDFDSSLSDNKIEQSEIDRIANEINSKYKSLQIMFVVHAIVSLIAIFYLFIK